MTDPSALAAQDAAEALIALGWPVVPTEDFEEWVLGCLVFSDADLMAFAARQGIMVGSERVQ